MKRRLAAWLLAVAVLVTLALVAWRGVETRRAAGDTQAHAVEPPTMVQLVAADLVRASVYELRIDVPLSGTLKAVHTALVKSRVNGQVRTFTLRAGDTVEAGQVIARIDPGEYDDRARQAGAQASAAQAQARVAQRQYENSRALAEQGFISATALANARANLDAARANVQAAQAAAQVARATAADTVVRAPIAGQVARRLVQAGERVGPEAPLVEIVDPTALELEAELNPADSVAVRVGQKARITVEGASAPVEASVARINPSAQSGSRQVVAYLSVAPAPGLRQGLFAQGFVTIGTERALALPLAAVRVDAPKPYVQVVVQDDNGRTRVRHVVVELGARSAADGETLVAVNGIDPGAWVLRSSAGPLQAGTLVHMPPGLPQP